MKTELTNLKAKVQELKIKARNATAEVFLESPFETKRKNIQRGKALAYENVEIMINELLNKVDKK